jgi:hypothetical protein
MRTAILALEMAFIVAVAVVAGVVEHRGWWTLAPVAGAWTLTLVSERLTARLAARSQQPSRRPRREAPAVSEPAAAAESHVRLLEREPELEPAPGPAIVQDAGVAPEQPVETPPEAEPEPEAEPPPVDAAPPVAEEPVAAPQPAAPRPEPEPEPEREPAAPTLTVVPPPAEVAPPQPEPAPARVAEQALDAEVVPLVQRGPQAWNIWDLERLTRAHAGTDALRDEERSYLLVYLREFASPEGVLPADFDALVRESFGDLVGTG